jgi:hypothetical protein
MAYIHDINLNNLLYRNYNSAFKNLWSRLVLPRKIQTETRYIFSRADILFMLNISETDITPTALADSNPSIEVFPTLENNKVIIYIDGLDSGGVGTVPQGVARNPGQ